jgi:hypothetical protein
MQTTNRCNLSVSPGEGIWMMVTNDIGAMLTPVATHNAGSWPCFTATSLWRVLLRAYLTLISLWHDVVLGPERELGDASAAPRDHHPASVRVREPLTRFSNRRTDRHTQG